MIVIHVYILLNKDQLLDLIDKYLHISHQLLHDISLISIK